MLQLIFNFIICIMQVIGIKVLLLLLKRDVKNIHCDFALTLTLNLTFAV
jgi:hypothetical protein